MTTEMKKVWFVDGQIIEQEIPESDIYKQAAQRQPLTDEMREQMIEASDSMEMRGAFANGWLSAEAAYNTEAVLVEEMQRMAKRIEDLEALLERQTARIVDLQTHIDNFEGDKHD